MKRYERPSSYWKSCGNIRARLDKTIKENNYDAFADSSVEKFAEWFFEDKDILCKVNNAGEEIQTWELVDTPQQRYL